jgi:beta-lactamase class A
MKPWILTAVLATAGCSGAGQSSAPPPETRPTAPVAPATAAAAPAPEAAVTERLTTLARESDGNVGVSVIHVESGRTAEVHASEPLPLYSVFKLPLAVVVLKEVEQGKLSLDQKIAVAANERVAGSPENTALWQEDSNRSLREMIELSIARSDNTSSDAMMRLAGGPENVTARLAALGFPGIVIRSPVREFLGKKGEHPNTASTGEIARLLAKIQAGDLPRQAERDLLLASMSRATTGLMRLRADLPPGTPVADKTGSGAPGTATNDVGIITLPEGHGHLAVAVLVAGSRKPIPEQEKLIARIARTAYDAFAR